MNDRPEKIAMTFAVIMQVLFVISFLAYCLSPIWAPLVFKR